MQEIVIVAGPNGSGKTSFAKRLCRENTYPFLNADEIAQAMPAGSLYNNRIKAGRLFLQEMCQLIQNHQSFVAESTLSGNYLATILKTCKDRYRISIVYVFLSDSHTCIDRIKERVEKGGHFVAEADVLRRYKRSQQRFWHIYRHICDDWKIINNDHMFLDIAAGRGHRYVVYEAHMFNVFIEGTIKE